MVNAGRLDSQSSYSSLNQLFFSCFGFMLHITPNLTTSLASRLGYTSIFIMFILGYYRLPDRLLTWPAMCLPECMCSLFGFRPKTIKVWCANGLHACHWSCTLRLITLLESSIYSFAGVTTYRQLTPLWRCNWELHINKAELLEVNREFKFSSTTLFWPP